jgi:hypothetical protein
LIMVLTASSAAADAAEDLSSRKVLQNHRRIGSSAGEPG